MIKFNKIEPETVEVWSDDFGFIGHCNEYEFNDIRVQIKNEQAIGYYVIFNNGRKHYIDIDGRLNWPSGLFDLITVQLRELIKN